MMSEPLEDARTCGLVAESEALHERVRAFVAGTAPEDDTFERLALDVARFQRSHSPGYRRLVEARGAHLDVVDELPAVPTDAFRFGRVATHGAELDVVRFRSSGSTDQRRSVHPMRSTRTYRDIVLRHGREALLPLTASSGGVRAERLVVVALAESPGMPPSSSLGFMMRTFMQEFDGRALRRDPSGAPFDPDASERWLMSGAGADAASLRRAALVAVERQEPLLVLATSFALVTLLDALAGDRVPAPKRTAIMMTGGFKGKVRSVNPEKLRGAVARAFRVKPRQVIGEYGMTELTSQLYEQAPGGYVPPPWLRVSAVDAATLRPVGNGERGLARFVDLGNVDSAVAVLTQDVVSVRDGIVTLHGRAGGAEVRGCSLPYESWLGSHREAPRGGPHA